MVVENESEKTDHIDGNSGDSEPAFEWQAVAGFGPTPEAQRIGAPFGWKRKTYHPNTPWDWHIYLH